MANGTVKWFNAEKRYGIHHRRRWGTGRLRHYSAIDMVRYKVLEEGQHVFEVGSGSKACRPRPSARPEPRLTEAPPFRPAALP